MQPHDIFDPTPGTFNNPTKAPDDAGNSPAASKPVTVPSTGNDYQGWKWEQTLVGVLGLQLPDRNDVAQAQWTAINYNSPGGTGMYRIYAASWGNNKDTFVYLNPNLLQPGGTLDNYIYVPKTAIYNAVVNTDYTGFQGFDPRSFATAADAVYGVTNFYNTTDSTFKNLSDAVAGDESAFKGQAGAAFAQLMNNLYKVADSAYQQIGVQHNYSQLITDAGNQSKTFLMSLWGGIVNWWNMVDHNPLGAIYQALMDGGVIASAGGGQYQLTNPTSFNSSFGDLRTAQAWQAVETAAKALWLASITSALDPVAQSAINALVNSYMNTASNAQPLTPPTLEQITVGTAAGANPNLDPGGAGALPDPGGAGALPDPGGAGALPDPGGAGALPDPGGAGALPDPGGAGALNLPGGAGNPMSALANPGGAGALNLPGGAGNPMSALANPGGAGALNLPGGAGNPMSALANPGGAGALNLPGGANVPGGVLAGLGAPGGPGGIPGAGLPGGVNSPQLGALQTALGNNADTQAALQKALSLAPATGPVHNALETALANNGKAGAALQAALGGTMPAATALQNALASNGQTQAALRQALALAPAKGPLHNALQSALNDSNKTQGSLNQTLANGSIPGTAPINQALHSDTALNSALNKALLSAQVPSHGPLHDALTSALGQSGHVKSALDQALAGGATTNTPALNHALSSNTALQADLRKALGQAPAQGPLHNELMSALADSKNIGTQIHQALAQAGVPAEPLPGMLSSVVGNPAAGLGSVLGPLGNHGLTATLGVPGGGGGGVSAGLGGGGLPGGGAGLPGGGAGVGLPAHGGAGAGLTGTPGLGGGAPGGAPVSSGRFVPSSAADTASANGSSAVPFFPPMAGAGGMGGAGQQQQQERERSTWLAEDEDVWGTDPQLGPAVLGRDFLDDDEDFDGFDEFDEPAPQPARDPSRIRAR